MKINFFAAASLLVVGAAGLWANALGAVGALAVAVPASVALGGCILQMLAARREERLRLALRRRDEQLAQTAHELRTPLTAIGNALEIVRAGYASDPDECDAFLCEADLAANHLGFLINDILDDAALTAGRLRLEIGLHRIADLIRNGLRALGMQAARNDIRIVASDSDRELLVRTDSRRVLQILFNLVGNAAKFSEPGSPIEIEVRSENAFVRFAVIDQGTGVAPAVEPMLFEPFVGDDATKRADSTGLGLYICRQLVEQMGGSIGYRRREAAAGGGAEFWFTMPRPQHDGIPATEPRADRTNTATLAIASDTRMAR
ncbi:MAG: sensor histidine kinase [Planctomycetota bacterium]